MQLTGLEQRETTVDANKCIICQKTFAKRTSSTENDRTQLRKAAYIRNDEVSKRLRLIADDNFAYNVTNTCYKGTLHVKEDTCQNC